MPISTVDRSTAPDGFGSRVTSIVRHVEATEKQGAIALTEMCVGQFATLIRNGKHFAEAELTVESYGLLDVLDRQDGYDRRNACDIVHGVALLFLAMNTIDSSEASGRLIRTLATVPGLIPSFVCASFLAAGSPSSAPVGSPDSASRARRPARPSLGWRWNGNGRPRPPHSPAAVAPRWPAFGGWAGIRQSQPDADQVLPPRLEQGLADLEVVLGLEELEQGPLQLAVAQVPRRCRPPRR